MSKADAGRRELAELQVVRRLRYRDSSRIRPATRRIADHKMDLELGEVAETEGRAAP
jgi:hypothetical protein